jgi:hypothetical protein
MVGELILFAFHCKGSCPDTEVLPSERGQARTALGCSERTSMLFIFLSRSHGVLKQMHPINSYSNYYATAAR